MPVRDEKMTKIVAGMGVADMDFRCAPAITEALQKRVAFPNWGYNMIDGDLFMGNAGGSPFIKGIVDWNQQALRHQQYRSQDARHQRRRHSRHHQRAAGLRAQGQQGVDGDTQLCRLLCRHRHHQDHRRGKPDEAGQWPLRDRLGRSGAPHDPGGESLDHLQPAQSGAAAPGRGTNSPAMASFATSTTSSSCRTRFIATSSPRATNMYPSPPWTKPWSTIPSPSSRAPRASPWRR